MTEAPRVSPRSLEVLEWPDIQYQLSERARTGLGKLLCLGLKPGEWTAAKASERARAVLETGALAAAASMNLPLGDIPDVRETLKRVSRSGAITVEDFASLVRAQKAAQGLSHFLLRYAAQCKSLQSVLSGLDLLDAWGRRHFPLLDPRGELVDSASEDLRALRGLAKELHEKIKNRLNDWLVNPKTQEILQDFYVTVRDGRYVIPVKTSFKGRVPGIIHDVSNTEATLFVEPQEVVEANNQLKITEREIAKEIERIMAEVVERTRPHVDAMLKNQALVALADQTEAAAKFLSELGGAHCVPRMGADFSFARLRHPLLALQRKVVANDFGFKEALILTGPNTGGKTVLLKSVGLAACMFWAGLPILADDATWPETCKGLLADIGDDQDLEQNLSTFSGHLRALNQMMGESRAGDLVLIDEIATGTSPEEGQPLAQAVIEELLNKHVRTLTTTHYGALKQFAMVDERCRIAAMAFDSKSRKPTYEIVLDIPGDSSAIETAEQAGLPATVIKRARALRGDSSEDLNRAIARLEEARRRFSDKESALGEEQEKLKKLEERALQRISEYEAKQRQGLSDGAREVLRNLNELREELSRAVKSATPETLGAGATALFQKLSEGADQVRGVVEESRRAEPSVQPLPDGDLAADAVVDIEGLGLGSIVEVPRNLSDPKAQVLVQVGEIRSRVLRSRLRKPAADRLSNFNASKAAVSAARERKAANPSYKAVAVSGSSVCDVRGRSVDEAMSRIESALNELVRDEDATVTIIHGHGMDRLKDAIRDYLTHKRSDLVFRPGSWPGEGGDGVTVVERAK